MATDEDSPPPGDAPPPSGDATPPGKDPTVKELIERTLEQPLEELVDAATRAELERWFGLPSYQQVAEGEVTLREEDPEMVAVRERREKALAAVSPALLEAHRRRIEPDEDMTLFRALLEPRARPDIARVDFAMIENHAQIAEPREIERSILIEDDLKECTPQALLRDLHRPDIDFEKTFEVVDTLEEVRVDPVAEVRDAIRTSWKLPPLGVPPARLALADIAEVRAEVTGAWATIPTRVNLPNRRVSE